MTKTFNFKVDAFDCSVKVIFTDEDDKKMVDRVKKIEKSHGEIHEDDNSSYHGACFSPDDNIYQYYLIFSTKALTHKLIAHECEHLKNYIFERFNYTIKSGDEELPATLTELIVGKIYDFAHKKEIRISI